MSQPYNSGSGTGLTIDPVYLRTFIGKMRTQVIEGHLTDTKSSVTQLVNELLATLDAQSGGALQESTGAVHTALQSLSDALEAFLGDMSRIADDTETYKSGIARTFGSMHAS